VIGAATTIYDRHHISSAISKAGPFARAVAQVGWGLNLALIASISLAVAGLVWLRKFSYDDPSPSSHSPAEAPEAGS
jgi:hypothetical protein